MDYKKIHEEALARAKSKIRNDKDHVLYEDDILDIFPELNESEDENIKEDIITYLSTVEDKELIPYETWIAWLEKQGEPVEINPTEFDTRLQTLIGKFDGLHKEELIGSLSFWLNVVQNDGTYREEKQCEQKPPIVDFKAKDWYVSKVDGKIYNAKFMEEPPTNQKRRLEIEKAAMSATGIIEQEEWFIKGAEWSDKNPSCISSKKQGEQNSANKVEPKFHEGEWVVDNCGYVWKIEGILNQFYLLESVEGCESHPTIEWVNKTFHLWTIQDAKDGDVLVYDGEIFLIKYYTLWHKIVYHCCYDGKNLYNHSIYDSLEKDDFNKMHPATKEQRDLLFQKMKEAGYGWDDEKKELKIVDWSKHIKYEPNGPSIIKEDSAWSEEDELIISVINSLINMAETKTGQWYYNGFKEVFYFDIRQWLKSLKDRVQPKQEWSEEDETKLKTARVFIKNTSLKNNDGIVEETLYWLKSLRYRYTWKPSDEQMRALDNARHSNPFNVHVLDTLFHNLKRLKE